MNVLYDYQIFVAQKFGGISRYFVDLMSGVELIDGFSVDLEVFGNQNYYLPNKYNGSFPFVERLKKYHKRSNKIAVRNNVTTLNKLKKDQIDIFHPTYYDPYFIDHINKPLVITIHDMIYENFPDLFHSSEPTAYNKRLHMERADKIIAVSHNTKADIVKFYPSLENKIEVVYHGLGNDFGLNCEDIINLPEQFVLYVGGRYGYKNFSLMIQAFANVTKEFKGLKLVVAGSPLGTAEEETLYRNGIRNKVIHISATDSQLNTLYKKAIFFIYPSTYEGFGLPILEAYKMGCPVLLSDASCFPEIARDAAAYFEVHALESLVEKMKVLLQSSFYRNSLIDLGKEKLKLYTMQACIENTVKVYQSLM